MLCFINLSTRCVWFLCKGLGVYFLLDLPCGVFLTVCSIFFFFSSCRHISPQRRKRKPRHCLLTECEKLWPSKYLSVLNAHSTAYCSSTEYNKVQQKSKSMHAYTSNKYGVKHIQGKCKLMRKLNKW